MILQIAPDYYNTALYARLFTTLHSQGVDSRVYVADNRLHESQPDQQIFCAPRSFNAIERIAFFPKQRIVLRDINDRYLFQNIDVIHAHTLFSSGYTAYQLYKQHKIPYIVAIRNTDVNVFMRFMPHLLPLGRQIASCAQKIIFISNAYQNRTLKRLQLPSTQDKSIVIPNGIDAFFLKNKSGHMADSQCIRLLFAARTINKNKNIEAIIKSTDSLRQQGYDISLTVVGDIIDNTYKELIDARTYIHWHASTPMQGMLKHFRNNDIFIMPSFHETFGLVYAEAMSQGLPVIYTENEGFDGQYSDGFIGYAVSAKDTHQISEAILRTYKEYTIISQRCLETVNKYDWDNIAQQYATIYKSITKD